MKWNLTAVLALVSLAFGVLLFILSVAGVFWPPTPVTDVGLLSTTTVFVALGIVGLLLARRQTAPAPSPHS
jgi:hypothetical protein